MSKEDKERMWKYRKENFLVKIEIAEPDWKSYDQRVYTIFATGNGSQYSAISLYGKEELLALKEKIDSILC